MLPIYWMEREPDLIPVVRVADLRNALCVSCRNHLPYKNGFHSAHPKSRGYFKLCEADALIGSED